MSGKKVSVDDTSKARPQPTRDAGGAARPAAPGPCRSQSARREEDIAAVREPASTAAGATRSTGELTQTAARRREVGLQEGRTRRPRGSEQPAGRATREPQPTPSAALPSTSQRSPQRRGGQGSPDEREEKTARACPEPPATSGGAPGAVDRAPSSEQASGETDSFDEEAELLRCQADLVKAAAEMDTTSADEEPLTTDPDFDDDEDGFSTSVLPTIRLLRPWQRPSMASVVIEEDEEGISSGLDDDGCHFEVDSSEMRSRLWAQSLLRLKRSIDEIYSLCEFESDEGLCEQVQGILETASKDFSRLMQQLNEQQEYALLAGDYPFKSGVAWTSRTPRAAKVGESVLEQLERAQISSPSHTPSHSTASGRSKVTKVGSAKQRSSSVELNRGWGAQTDEQAEMDDIVPEFTGAGAGEPASSEADSTRRSSSRPRSMHSGPGDQLQLMVQSALRRVQTRLGQAPSKPSPEEIQKRQEDRQKRAQQLRASQDDQKMLQLRQVESRLLAARERREERAQQRQRELLERMTRARRQYQDQLRIICQRARNENRKTAEVAYIAKEALKSEKDLLKKKQEHAHISRALAREKMRNKLIESANRVAKVSENRRRQWETWQSKVQQELEEKERLADQRRREHLQSIRVKSQGHENRSEMVRGKRRELQEEDDKSSQDFLRFSNKHIGRMALNCDGLPDGVREEVVVQLQQSPTASTPARRSGATTAGSRHKGARPTGRCTTPPPTATSPSPKSSPKGTSSSVQAEVTGSSDWQASQALTRSLPAFPSTGELELLGITVTVPASLPEPPPLPNASESSPSPSTRPADAAATGQGVAAGQGQAHLCESPGSRLTRRADKARGGLVRPASATTLRPRPGGSTSPCATAGSLAAASLPAGGGGFLPSDGSDEDLASETEPPVALSELQQTPEEVEALARCRETLRGLVASDAQPDEDALRVACEQEGGKAVASNSAHRTKISKLATDLGKVLSGASGDEGSSAPQPASSSVNLDRADALLGDFCKLLSQFQKEADYALVLKFGCGKSVVEICSRIRDSIGMLSGSTDRSMPPAWRQTSNALLGALKWLGLMSKQPLVRVFFLLTNRVLPLADLALACLDAHFSATSPLPEAQSVAVLFLPQVLHLLSLFVKQPLPDSASSFKQNLVSYLLLCGLSEKLCDLLKQAEAKGTRLFESASPVPLLLLRATAFLGGLVGEYYPNAPPNSLGASVQGGELHPVAAVLRMLRRTELFGVVSVLVSILLSGGGRAGQPSGQAPELSRIVTSLAAQVVRMLNQVARIHLTTLQETLGACRQQELYHFLVSLFDYCTSRPQGATKAPAGQTQDETELLHEVIILLGYYCLQRSENQGIMCYGEGQTLLAKVASLPMHYFMDERAKAVLFPTILATCYGSEQNLECLRNEMNLSLLQKYLTAQLALGQNCQCPTERFPKALWQDALTFFSDAALPPSST